MNVTPADSPILLGFEIGTGQQVDIPTRHLAVTGQTQQSGKTTTLEALVARSGMTALTFITKRGEQSFQEGRRVQPYFRDRADWMFVDNLLSAVLQEKNKFLRPWIMKICRTTKTLADVHREVILALSTAKGIHEGVYTQLNAYLDLIVPEIERAQLSPALDLQDGLNVMDVSAFSTPMQMLFVQSALDFVNDHAKHTLVVIPEAWEFIPEGKGSPVKASAIALARKGAALRNFIWVDSQDMAGVDKTILRACTVWLIGVQREANEIKRSLSNIPAGIKKPSAADVALLERGQFFACWGRHCVKTYVAPVWMDQRAVHSIAIGFTKPFDRPAPEMRRPPPGGPHVNQAEAEALHARNAELETQLAVACREVGDMKDQLQRMRLASSSPADDRAPVSPADADNMARPDSGRRDGWKGWGPEPAMPDRITPEFLDAMLDAFEQRLCERPTILALLRTVPEIQVTVQRQTLEVDGASTKGRIALLLSEGFLDAGVTIGGMRAELKRRGTDPGSATTARTLQELHKAGFLTLEPGDKYTAVQGMKSNIRQTNG